MTDGAAVMGDERPWLAALNALPDRVRLPMSIDPDTIDAALGEVAASGWTPHFVPAHYAGDWAALPLRAPAGAVHPILQIAANPGTTEWVETAHLCASPALKAMLSRFACPIEGARLMRLTAGSTIHVHRDDDLNAGWGQARLHIPLLTHDAVDFRLNGNRVVMATGECWYLRLSDPHEVHNRGLEDRIHLVFDVKVDRWLAAQLIAGADHTGD